MKFKDKEQTMSSTGVFQKFFLIFLAVCGILLLSGCPVNTDDDDEGGTIAGLDATSYNTAGSYSIRIKNESNRDLVACKSRLSEANILGMVPKQAGDHGLKMNTVLFPPGYSQDFSVVFLTRKDYEQYKGSLSGREQYPFTRIFAAYNASGTNETPWIVSGRLGGNNMLVINNMTSWNMELREDSPRGTTTLGYAPYESSNTTLYVNQGGFYVFPVFKLYNPPLDEIITVYPRYADGNPVKENLSFEDGNAPLTINAGTYMTNTVMSFDAAYLTVRNNSNSGITVYNGNVEKTTAAGISVINREGTRTFPILMDTDASGGYEASKSISEWKVVFMDVLEKDIPEASLEAGYRYTVEVSGDWSLGVDGVTVSAPQRDNDKVTAWFGDI